MRLSSKKPRARANLELNMTSMIDVVFLLLIFFMVTTSVVMSERQLRAAIRVEEETSSETQSDLEPAIVDIVLSGQQYVYQLGANEFRDTDSLAEALDAFENKFDGAFVRVSDGAPVDMSVGAIQACKTAGFFSVSYVPLD